MWLHTTPAMVYLLSIISDFSQKQVRSMVYLLQKYCARCCWQSSTDVTLLANEAPCDYNFLWCKQHMVHNSNLPVVAWVRNMPTPDEHGSCPLQLALQGGVKLTLVTLQYQDSVVCMHLLSLDPSS